MFHSVELEFVRDSLHDLRTDSDPLLDIGIDERVVAQEVHNARDTTRVQMYGVDSLPAEDGPPVRASNPQPFRDVFVRLLPREK